MVGNGALKQGRLVCGAAPEALQLTPGPHRIPADRPLFFAGATPW